MEASLEGRKLILLVGLGSARSFFFSWDVGDNASQGDIQILNREVAGEMRKFFSLIRLHAYQ